MATPAKTKTPANAPAAPAAATETNTAAAPAVAKKTKAPKVVLPQTDAQKAAQAALEKANAEAKAELLAKSADKLKVANAKIAEIEGKLKEAKAEKKALLTALGVKPGAAKKVTVMVYLKDFPEGKGAPQARQILEIIKAAGKDGVARDKVVETMKSVIKTDMDRSRLLSFYTSKMVTAGVIVTP